MTAALPPAEADALVRYRPGDREGLVESLFLKLNLPEARALWLKVTFLRPAGAGGGGGGASGGGGDDECSAWAIAFDGGKGHLALKSSWPAAEATVGGEAFSVAVGPVELAAGKARGELRDEESGDRIAWDLRFTPDREGFRHLPHPWMYRGPFPKTKATSPWIDARFDGTIEVGGEVWRVEGAPGMLGHNWGSRHADGWTWAHCNAWSGVDGVLFEGVTAKVKMGPVTTPFLTTLHVRIPGERMTLNALTQLVRTKSEPHGLSWRVSGRQRDRRVVAHFHGPPERFVGLDYHEPDGGVVHCLNTKIGDGELRVDGRTVRGFVPLLTAVADRTAALEVGSRGETWGVPIRVR